MPRKYNARRLLKVLIHDLACSQSYHIDIWRRAFHNACAYRWNIRVEKSNVFPYCLLKESWKTFIHIFSSYIWKTISDLNSIILGFTSIIALLKVKDHYDVFLRASYWKRSLIRVFSPHCKINLIILCLVCSALLSEKRKLHSWDNRTHDTFEFFFIVLRRAFRDLSELPAGEHKNQSSKMGRGLWQFLWKLKPKCFLSFSQWRR